MSPPTLLRLARQATAAIHDEPLHVRALLKVAELEQACRSEPTRTLAAAESLVRDITDPSARAVLACDMAQTQARLGRDPYWQLDFARTTASNFLYEADSYVALVEAPDRIFS